MGHKKSSMLLFVGDYRAKLSDSMFSLFVHNFMVDFWGNVDRVFPTGSLMLTSDYDPPYLKISVEVGGDFSLKEDVVSGLKTLAEHTIGVVYQNLIKSSFSTILTSITFRRP